MEFSYPENMTKSQAFIRRAGRFIEWLNREEYRVYNGEQSVNDIIRLIKIISYAFNASMIDENWQPFYMIFKECRMQMRDTYETEEARETNYYQVIKLLLETLESYKAYIPDHVIGEGQYID